MTVTKLKEMGSEVMKKLKREKELKHYQNNVINILIFYTGDVNNDFSQDPILNSEELTINGQKFLSKVSVYYVSKVALFNHFAKANKLNNIEYLDDKIITLFELKRMSLRRR